MKPYMTCVAVVGSAWLVGQGIAHARVAHKVPSPTPAILTDYPVGEKLDGPQSAYTTLLLQILKNWPPKHIDYGLQGDGPINIRCIETAGNPLYIGLEQFMEIDAPFERVAAVLDDFAHYKDLFPDFEDIHVVSQDKNKFVLFWEQHIPVFFIPNVKYEINYLIDSSVPSRRVYRYQLRKSENMRNNDGMIVIEKREARTRYTEWDFYDADWGLLKTVAPGRIWKESVEGIYLSDAAIRLKAEHPDWDYPKVKKESKKMLEQFPVDGSLKKRGPVIPTAP